MDDLISRSVLLEATANFCDGYKVNWSDKKVLAWINAAPAVDAVPVVRCKDCKFRKPTFNGEDYFCTVWDTDESETAYVTETDFCSYGERRNGERLIDADALSENIRSGAGTALQKFFADICVAAAPTIEAEPVRHGRWEYRAVDTPNLGRRYEMYCTACGKTPDPKKWYDYCPNCGAKMDKENDNETP